MKVTAISIKNVYDKEQYYVKIENNGKTVVINVGLKTWKAVADLEQDPPKKEPQKIKPTL